MASSFAACVRVPETPRIDDLLESDPLRGVGGSSHELEQKVRRGGVSLFEAHVTVALVDAQGRPRRVSRDMAKAMALLPQSGP